jgi:hypothetical protein
VRLQATGALSVKLHRNGWHLELGHRVPSDPAGDDGAIYLIVAQLNLEIGEGRVGLFDDGVGCPQGDAPETILPRQKNRTELFW